MSTSSVLPAYAKYEYFVVTSPSEFVAHVEINRPKKLNAFSSPMWHEYRLIFNQLNADVDVRAVVVSGAGDRAFSAGLDVAAATQGGALAKNHGAELDTARKAKVLREEIQTFQDSISAAEKCGKRESPPGPSFSIYRGRAILGLLQEWTWKKIIWC
jgi:Delta3,5-Delta2,4-dienoyl-CoA isomerase